MKRVKIDGTKAFCIIYNILGFVGIEACCYGFVNLSNDGLIVQHMDYMTQTLTILLTLLFFLSTFLLLLRKNTGYMVPIFLLTFFITGGFVVLIPLLALHLFYFTKPRVHTKFS